MWCVATRQLLNAIPAYDGERFESLCTTKDGQYVATAGYREHTIKLWKADTLNIEATLVGHSDDVKCVVATGMHVMYVLSKYLRFGESRSV